MKLIQKMRIAQIHDFPNLTKVYRTSNIQGRRLPHMEAAGRHRRIVTRIATSSICAMCFAIASTTIVPNQKLTNPPNLRNDSKSAMKYVQMDNEVLENPVTFLHCPANTPEA
jgi:hypothetical protein